MYRCSLTGEFLYILRDNRLVLFISNYHKIDATTVQRKDKNGFKCTVTCLNVVKAYNAIMGGVSKHDMLRQLYGVSRKRINYWHRLFFWLFEMAIFIAHNLYSEGTSITLLQFTRS